MYQVTANKKSRGRGGCSCSLVRIPTLFLCHPLSFVFFFVLAISSGELPYGSKTVTSCCRIWYTDLFAVLAICNRKKSYLLIVFLQELGKKLYFYFNCQQTAPRSYCPQLDHMFISKPITMDEGMKSAEWFEKVKATPESGGETSLSRNI